MHMHEPARQKARELANTAAFASAQRARKKVEALFAELKHRMGVGRLRLRRLKFVREQFFLAAAAQNIKHMDGPKVSPNCSFFNSHACSRQLLRKWSRFGL